MCRNLVPSAVGKASCKWSGRSPEGPGDEPHLNPLTARTLAPRPGVVKVPASCGRGAASMRDEQARESREWLAAVVSGEACCRGPVPGQSGRAVTQLRWPGQGIGPMRHGGTCRTVRWTTAVCRILGRAACANRLRPQTEQVSRLCASDVALPRASPSHGLFAGRPCSSRVHDVSAPAQLRLRPQAGPLKAHIACVTSQHPPALQKGDGSAWKGVAVAKGR